MTVAKNHLSNSQIEMFNDRVQLGARNFRFRSRNIPAAREKKPLVPRGSDRVAFGTEDQNLLHRRNGTGNFMHYARCFDYSIVPKIMLAQCRAAIDID